MQLKDATVLLVDDEAGLLEIFKLWMEREGCRVLTATNGQEGLDLALQHNVDVVVSDVRMPGLNGIEMVRHLKAAKNYIPKIIFISGFADISERECFDLGIELTLAKPARRASLISAIQQCLLDREEAWQQPSMGVPEKILAVTFPSLAAALQERRIAFGRGGFCIRSTINISMGKLIGLRLVFQSDQHAVIGEGVVRWAEYSEQLLGIEITSVDDENRSWVVNLTAGQKEAVFIPRSSGG